MKRPTIKDIARLAEVTPATVSMALNDSGRISAKTRERIREIAQQLDYRPNPLARGLVARKTHLVGVILIEVADSFFKDILRGLEDALQPEGYGILLNVTNGDPEREARFLRFQTDKRVDALIMEPTMRLDNRAALEKLVVAGLPILTILHTTWGWGNSSVSVNNELGAREATDYLAQRCRRVAHLSGPKESVEAEARMSGYRKALRKVGQALDPRMEPPNESGRYTHEEGYAQMRRLLLGDIPRPDGVFAASDSLALGAIRAIHDAGLRVPEDVEVVGFDDIEIASLCRPPLTTIAQPKYRLGKKAGEILLRVLDKKTAVREILKPHLVVRESTFPRPKE